MTDVTELTYPNAGDRVRMTGLMPNDPAPLPIGTEGTVVVCHPKVRQITVDWDNGSSLILLPTDPYEVIDG